MNGLQIHTTFHIGGALSVVRSHSTQESGDRTENDCARKFPVDARSAQASTKVVIVLNLAMEDARVRCGRD